MTACSLFGGRNLFRLFSIPTRVDSGNGKGEGKAGKATIGYVLKIILAKACVSIRFVKQNV